jgi:hypothetical protein
MSALEVAGAHARERASLAERIRREFALAWAAVDPARISESWSARIAALLPLLVGAQRVAAGQADAYLTAVLDQQDLTPTADGRVNAVALTGSASGGRNLATLLTQPGIIAKAALAQGATIERAMTAGGALAELIGHTQVADAGRIADQVALTARPQATGYVRMIVGKTCSRCLILAGRWYAYNTGFRRHPKCDCIHIPGREDMAGDLRTDPDKAFAALSRAEQDSAFGKAGAEAIRSGADMATVVNARRGMYTAADGRRYTREAATRQRLRMMPEQIFREATDRDDAIRLLRLHGYLR